MKAARITDLLDSIPNEVKVEYQEGKGGNNPKQVIPDEALDRDEDEGPPDLGEDVFVNMSIVRAWEKKAKKKAKEEGAAEKKAEKQRVKDEKQRVKEEKKAAKSLLDDGNFMGHDDKAMAKAHLEATSDELESSTYFEAEIVNVDKRNEYVEVKYEVEGGDVEKYVEKYVPTRALSGWTKQDIYKYGKYPRSKKRGEDRVNVYKDVGHRSTPIKDLGEGDVVLVNKKKLEKRRRETEAFLSKLGAKVEEGAEADAAHVLGGRTSDMADFDVSLFAAEDDDDEKDS